MNFNLKRKDFVAEGILGELTDDKGTLFFTTLEHAYLEPDGTFKPKIEAGVHACKRYASPEHGYDLFILNSPNDAGHFFEIHIGNYNVDSKGCILIGLGLGFLINGKGRMLVSSTQAFKKFMEAQKECDAFTLTIE